ncbi:MAG: tetratricopeptide repeat protein [Methanobacteriota archaeon]|nr:MAG: tetratricopeptide repeat protein [Euryarchaeota archaeon]
MKVRGRRAPLREPRSLAHAVPTTKTDEAKAALEKGDFDKAMGLVEAALSEQPDDPSARELYAVTHLARAIRLSDKAREARRTDLLRREIDYDQEFQDVPEVARTLPRSTMSCGSIRCTGRRGCSRPRWCSVGTATPAVRRPSRSSASSRPRIRRTSRFRSRSGKSNGRARGAAIQAFVPVAWAAAFGGPSDSSGSARRATAAGSAPRAASSDHSSSSSSSAIAESLPSIHSTRSARPTSPQARHSHPRA